MIDIKIFILAGGKGTRLWPISRENYPKQFIKIFDNYSLFQKTILRALNITKSKKIFIISSRNYEDLIKADLENIAPDLIENIIYEPESKNTLPAIMLGTYSCNPKDIILVLSSDHFIADDNDFCKDVKLAINEAKNGNFVLFGVNPTRPETGFGYIEAINCKKRSKIYDVKNFYEKPDYDKALKFLQNKSYFWNAGIFLFSFEAFVNSVKKFEPHLFKSYRKGKDFFLKNFSSIKSQSIDYGIIEKVDKDSLKMVPASFRWSDLGNFESMYETFKKNEDDNVFLGNDSCISMRSSGNLVINSGKLIVTIGVSNIVIADTEDALLIMKKGEGQTIREVVNDLSNMSRKELFYNKTGYRPWGNYTILLDGDRYKIKKITVNPKASLSLQMHHHRSEHWVVIKGTAKVTIGEKIVFVHENESIFIPKSTLHRLENPGKVSLEIIEVQNGEYLEEDDIIRFDDKYKRL